MDYASYQEYKAWIIKLPKVREFVGACCLGVAQFEPAFQVFIEQVKMLNLYGRFKMAALTTKMLDSASIIGIYRREFRDDIKAFRTAWAPIKQMPPNEIPFLALTQPEKLVPVQGRDWEKLYTLTRVWYESSEKSMNLMKGYDNAAVLAKKELYLQPVTAEGGGNIISPDEADQMGLPRIKEQEKNSERDAMSTLLQVLGKISPTPP
nr:TPA_asm: hypothetical protein 1 [Moniex tapwovirus]